MDKKVKQIDFYPDGRIEIVYFGQESEVSQASIKPMTPKEALHQRLEQFKKKKNTK